MAIKENLKTSCGAGTVFNTIVWWQDSMSECGVCDTNGFLVTAVFEFVRCHYWRNLTEQCRVCIFSFLQKYLFKI